MGYYERAVEKLDGVRNKKDLTILSIESSCDETAVAILVGDEVKADIISSQIEIHKRFGGVVPEIASRKHTEAIDNLVEEALTKAEITLDKVDVIAVTYGAGLLGALLVGVTYAKALAFATDKPLVAVNHVKGHIEANKIVNKDLKPPFISLLCSGGHTEITKVEESGETLLGRTQDDAVGEAFDKVARVIGLSYPGGPEIEKASKGRVGSIEFSKPLKGQTGYDFSYSGLKTQVINYVRNREARGETIDREEVASSFQRVAVEMLVENAIRACLDTKIMVLSAGGGVCANGYLREKLSEETTKNGIKLYLPEKRFCTDNAVMIASKARSMILSGALPSDLDLDAEPNL